MYCSLLFGEPTSGQRRCHGPACVNDIDGPCTASATEDPESLLHRHSGEAPLSRANLQYMALLPPCESHGGVAALLIVKTIARVIIDLENPVSSGVHADLDRFVRR